MRIADNHPEWSDTLEAVLPAAGAATALLIMLVALIF
jgi:hypothetical protein